MTTDQVLHVDFIALAPDVPTDAREGLMAFLVGLITAYGTATPM